MGMYRKALLQLDDQHWTRVKPPFRSYSIVLRNSSAVDVLIRSNERDAGTEDRIPPATQEVIRSPGCFATTDVVAVLKSSRGGAAVVCTFTS